jgi:signal transduction histidine kinase/ActR/RegA family two-component response regulator
MFADNPSAYGFGWVPMALAAGLVGLQLTLQLLSLDRAHRDMLSAVLSGLVLGATAGTIVLLALCAWFGFPRIALPIGWLAIALPLCMAGALGSVAATAYGRRDGGRRRRAVLFALVLPALNIAALACVLPLPDWQASTATPGALAPAPLSVVLAAELLAGMLLVRAAERSARDRQHETEEWHERTRVAAEVNRARSSFLAMMSHEIRTPMNAVLGLVSVMLDEDLPDNQRTVVSAIRQSTGSLLRILNDILDFSRLDAGRLAFTPGPFSPATLTQEALSVHGPAAMAKGLYIGTDIGADLPAVLLGDAGRLRQVLDNLVSNAVKFTAAGEVLIRARCLERLDDAARMQWEVCDTGIGVPADRLGHLFVEFVQADDSIARRYGGSGLGLAISRRIVEQMGGAIEAESRQGEGSVFRFSVTLRHADTAALPAAAGVLCDQADRFRAALQRLGRPMRVLLAEDNPTNQFVVKLLLRGFDVALDMVADGRAAVQAASATPYDAICMDMLMPEMDGLQATRAIRRLGGTATNLPIIALTANAFPEDVKACMEAGMTDFAAKPVSREALLQVLETALSTPRDPRLARAA